MVVEKDVKNFPRKKKDKNGNVVKTYDVLRIDLKKIDGFQESEKVWILNQQEFEEFQLLKNSDGTSLVEYEEKIQTLENQLKESQEELNKQSFQNILQEIQQLNDSMENNFQTIESKNEKIIKLNKEVEKLKNNNKHILTIFKTYIETISGFSLLQRMKSSTIKNLSDETKKELEFYDETLFLEGDGKVIDEE